MIEDRLRAAARAVGESVGDRPVPPLDLSRLPSRQFHTRPRRTRFTTALAPVAAAAAVLAVTAALVAVSGGRYRYPASQGSVLAEAPRYYLAQVPEGRNPIGPQEAVIRDTVTGATLVTIRPSRPFLTFGGVAGGSDDLTFVLAEEKGTAYDSAAPTKFLLVRFHPADRSVTLTTLPVPEIPTADLLTGMALSPSGTELAIAVLTGRQRAGVRLSLYSLTTGAARTWQGAGTIGDSPFDTSSISLSRTGEIAFNWAGGNGSRDGIYLLDTAGPGGNLLAQSRLVIPEPIQTPRHPPAFGISWDGVLTADGTKIVAAVLGTPGRSGAQKCPLPGARTSGNPQPTQNGSTPITRGTSPSLPVTPLAFGEYSAATGRLIRIMHLVMGCQPLNNDLEWTNSSGSLLVVGAPATSQAKADFGVLSDNRFSPIPGAPPVTQSIVVLAF
jgi:hypothetical protein